MRGSALTFLPREVRSACATLKGGHYESGSWIKAGGTLSAIILSLAPGLLSAQADRPQARVIAPHEGHIGVQPNGVQGQSKVGSLSTGASQLSVGTATFPPRVETATHLHEIDEEVLYVLSGEIAVTLDGKGHKVGPGGTVFIPPGTWMAIANRTDAPAVVLGVLSRGEVEECFRVLFSRDSDEAARREALARCRIRNP